jgi:hypothetical protein
MPFKSKAQQRYMFAAEARGDLKKGTAREWAHETKDIKKLPERVKKASFGDLEDLIKERAAGLHDSTKSFTKQIHGEMPDQSFKGMGHAISQGVKKHKGKLGIGLLAASAAGGIPYAYRKAMNKEASFWDGFEKEAASAESLKRLGKLALTDSQKFIGRFGRTQTSHQGILKKIASDRFSMGRHSLELAGLGVLAAPSASHLLGHEMSDKHKAQAEVGGLGMLAAPYAHDILKKKTGFDAVKAIGSKFKGAGTAVAKAL